MLMVVLNLLVILLIIVAYLVGITAVVAVLSVSRMRRTTPVTRWTYQVIPEMDSALAATQPTTASSGAD